MRFDAHAARLDVRAMRFDVRGTHSDAADFGWVDFESSYGGAACFGGIAQSGAGAHCCKRWLRYVWALVGSSWDRRL